VAFAARIDPLDVTISRSGYDLVLTLNANDSLTMMDRSGRAVRLWAAMMTGRRRAAFRGYPKSRTSRVDEDR